ncbi:helix-turn-helix domain-containing protein [Parabacteroides distasonis]|uniref:helix-turn-helix domain-containing protein n=1 Tax=Parabacteroides distasonis TaxID=823 RepID=UPI001BA479E3|nr:helix-turn-helix domain-containing protein [Parabacteroides distasonis]
MQDVNPNEWISLFVLALKRRIGRDKIHYPSLATCNGHRGQATRLLKINSATLYSKMKKYDLR